jgi:hypothetical protein
VFGKISYNLINYRQTDWGWLILRDPTEQASSSLPLKTEIDPVSETSCSSFLIPNDGQNPEHQ